MSIKHLFQCIFSVAAFMAMVAVIMTVEIKSTSEDALGLAGYRFESYQIGQEVTIDSDNLTRLARTYVVTLEAKYKNEYFRLVDKIEGKAPRPDGEVIAFTDLLERNGFSQREKSLLDQSTALSIALIETEEKAFALVEPLEGLNPAQLSTSQQQAWIEALALLHNAAYHAERDKIFSPVTEFEALLDNRTHSGLQHTSAWLNRMESGTVFAAIVLLIVIVSSFFLISNRVVKPLTGMVDNSVRLSQGDFSVSFYSQQKDEIGAVCNALQNLVKHFSESISHIQHNSQLATDASNTLAQNSTRSRALSTQQKDQTLLSATAIEQMSRSAEIVSHTCQEASLIVERAVANLATTETAVSDTLGSIDMISSDVTHSLTKLDELSSAVEGVTSVVDVINSIAEQTNLLALNAAIEAARAGEQGRGFAVVADEVRSLAQRTQSSTSEILETVQQLNTRSGDVKQAMIKSNEVLAELIDKSRSVSSAIDEVSQAMNEIQGVTSQIETASSEQTSVSADVGRQVTQISTQAADIDQLSDQLSHNSSEVQSIAKNLKESISFFRV